MKHGSMFASESQCRLLVGATLPPGRAACPASVVMLESISLFLYAVFKIKKGLGLTRT